MWFLAACCAWCEDYVVQHTISSLSLDCLLTQLLTVATTLPPLDGLAYMTSFYLFAFEPRITAAEPFNTHLHSLDTGTVASSSVQYSGDGPRDVIMQCVIGTISCPFHTHNAHSSYSMVISHWLLQDNCFLVDKEDPGRNDCIF